MRGYFPGLQPVWYLSMYSYELLFKNGEVCNVHWIEEVPVFVGPT